MDDADIEYEDSDRDSDDGSEGSGMDDHEGALLEYVEPLMKALFAQLHHEMWRHPTERDKEWGEIEDVTNSRRRLKAVAGLSRLLMCCDA